MKTQKGATLVGSLVAITILATTLVAVLNLQVSIIRAKFFLQYDNTANLLVAEGLEIVRALYANNGTVPNGEYEVDYNSSIPLGSSTCTDISIDTTCDLMQVPSTGNRYRRTSNTTTTKIFHRFVTIEPSSTPTIPKVTSTVLVRNPKGGNLRVYKATIELYKIN